MKKTLLAVLMLSVAATAQAAEQRARNAGPTNVDWLLMRQDERMATVTKLVEDLQAKGLPLGATPERYAVAITAVAEDPQLKKETPVSNILLSIAYTKEPAVRRLLDASKAKRAKSAPAPAAKPAQ